LSGGPTTSSFASWTTDLERDRMYRPVIWFIARTLAHKANLENFGATAVSTRAYFGDRGSKKKIDA
jgi:hypothetical protein